MWIVVAFLIGMLAGGVVMSIVSREKPIGSLRIDQSDPSEAPYLFLQLSRDTDISSICKQKYVTLQVRVENFISQK